MKIKHLFIAIALITAFSSCQKVIDVDLNSSDSKYVIEGGVTNTAPCRLRITQTKNFSDDNTFPGVDNAFVTIADNAGNRDTLHYTSQGYYESTAMTGVPGRSYYLSVKIYDEVFTATSVMPAPVNLDSLYITDFTGFSDTIKLVTIDYFDPAGEANWYRFVLTLNNELQDNIEINSDEFGNGRPASQNIFYRDGERSLEQGDSVMIEMQCIDKDVYHYFFTLDQTIGQSSAAPTNPISNISGGALGFFSANTVQRKSIRVQ